MSNTGIDTAIETAINGALHRIEQERDVRIDTLMAQKKAGFESDRGPRIDVLNEFLAAELTRFESLLLKPPKKPGLEEMDRFFRRALHGAWDEPA